MARKPSPWYWPERRGWYTILNGQRHHLLDLPPDAPEPKKRGNKWIVPHDVDQVFHALMVAPPECPVPKTPPTGPLVAEILDKYLDWCKKHRAPRTYEWYHDHIQDFINRKPEAAKLPVSALKPFHVVEWVDSHGDEWSNAYRRGAIVAIQRPFNWAEELGYVENSPIKRIPKPQAQRREQFVTPEDWERIKNHYRDGDPFRDLLEFSWDTGCRPQESKRVEGRHVQLEQHRVVFPAEEAKGKKFARVIWLTPRAEEILRRHLDQNPEGVLFRNEDRQPWTAQALACRFGRLKDHLGVKYACYDIRHGFGTRKLVEGHDHLVVAELMGHKDGRMLAQTYQHLNQHGDHLRRVLENRTEPSKSRGL